jgi:ribonuclease D
VTTTDRSERAQQPRFIESSSALQDICGLFADSSWAMIDTEFMRESTYFPQLCLVQIAVPDAIWLIDPLTVPLAPLWFELNRTDSPLVFHAAEQDLELIYLGSGALPHTLRDSQIAAAFLGLGDQIGYANLVLRLLHIELDKSQSRTNWAQRPLSEAQRQYAADDVRFLRTLYPILREQLAAKNRLEWFDEECAALSVPQRFQPQVTGLWRKVRGQQTLRAAQRAVLEAITTWRETWARELNLPRRWVLSDEQALELAGSRQFRPALLNHSNARHHLTDEQKDELRATIDRAKQLPPEAYPQWQAFQRPDPATNAMLNRMQTWVQERSKQMEISPSLLATTDDLLRLIRTPDAPTKLTTGWRNDVIGLPLKSLLD